MADHTPALREITLTDVCVLGSLPGPKIRTDDDVELWKSTQSYVDYKIFLKRLNNSVIGVSFPWEPENQTQVCTVKIYLKIIDLETTVDSKDVVSSGCAAQVGRRHSTSQDSSKVRQFSLSILGTAPRGGWPLQSFASFTHIDELSQNADLLLDDLLGVDLAAVKSHIKPYFLTSFGSFTRLDYGTGHEASFALFLLCLTLVRFFQPQDHEERNLVMVVFLQYLRLCWKLQDVYKLEPAGSHGVWGLDDYCFLPYIFGSGQLRGSSYIAADLIYCSSSSWGFSVEDQDTTPVSAILQSPLPPSNLYFMAITRIREVKYGPFHEHSSQLHSIAMGVPNWGKVNSGLFKMYEVCLFLAVWPPTSEKKNLPWTQAEVLGKRVVVQHIPLGGLLEWEKDVEDPTTILASRQRSPHGRKQMQSNISAPWARTLQPSMTHAPVPNISAQSQRMPAPKAGVFPTPPLDRPQ